MLQYGNNLYWEDFMFDNNFVNENVIVAFIDTSSIDPMFNNYNNMEHLFSALKKHINSNKLILITHEIALREMENHIKDRIPKQIEKYTAIQASKEFSLLKMSEKYQYIFNSIDSEQIIADTIKIFREKLKEIGIVILKTGTISVNKLLDDYFFSRSPFGTKNKKAEFPDAIMLQSLIRAVGEDKKIHIIAYDGDWENVCETSENLFLHKNLNIFLDYINKDNIASSAIKTYLSKSSTKELVTTKLDEIIQEIDFSVDGRSFDADEGYIYDEVELLKVYDISYVLHTIEDIICTSFTEDYLIEAVVTIVGSANIKFNCTYFDEENSIWDSVDHEYIYQEYGRNIETHEFLFPIRLVITGDYKKDLEITDYKLVEETDISSLGGWTLIKREHVSDHYSMRF